MQTHVEGRNGRKSVLIMEGGARVEGPVEPLRREPEGVEVRGKADAPRLDALLMIIQMFDDRGIDPVALHCDAARHVELEAPAGIGPRGDEKAAPDRIVPGEAEFLGTPRPLGRRSLLLLDAVAFPRGLGIGRGRGLGPRQRRQKDEKQGEKGPEHGWHSVSAPSSRQARRDSEAPRRVSPI